MSSSNNNNAPLRIKIIVYDLLPPGRLSSILNFVGSGVYHSSVSLAIPLGPSDTSNPTAREYAFGGHDQPGVTGIFSIPEGTAHMRMPGLKYYLTYDAGEAFGDDWNKVFGPKRRRSSSSGLALNRSWSILSSSGETGGSLTSSPRDSIVSSTRGEKSPPGSTNSSPYLSGGASSEDAASKSTTHLTSVDSEGFLVDEPVNDGSEDWLDDDGGERDGTQYLTKHQRLAYRIIEGMKREPEWNGNKYLLLEKNCNSFTNELVWRLTGRRAPGYLNRAAWFATSAPCLIPAGFIDEDDSQQAGSQPSQGSVVVVPPRADQMSLSGHN
ncbi:DUF862-domain-containing protein [Meredithblackwellia eburnea MCA 4105]